MYKAYRAVQVKQNNQRNLTAQSKLTSSLDLFQSISFHAKGHSKSNSRQQEFLISKSPSFVTSKKDRAENKIRSQTVKTPTLKGSPKQKQPVRIIRSLNMAVGSEALNENTSDRKLMRRCQTALKRFDQSSWNKRKEVAKQLDEEPNFSFSVDLKRMAEPIFDKNDFMNKRGPFSHQSAQNYFGRTACSQKGNNYNKNDKKKGNTFSQYYSKQIRKKSESDKLKSKEAQNSTPMKIVSLEKKKQTKWMPHQDVEEIFCPWEKSLDIRIAGITINSLKVPQQDKGMMILFESKSTKKNNFSRFKEKAIKEQNLTGWASEEDHPDENG